MKIYIYKREREHLSVTCKKARPGVRVVECWENEDMKCGRLVAKSEPGKWKGEGRIQWNSG